jgi:hypothetical protein
MPLSCTEERLKMRSRGYLTWLLHRYGKPAKSAYDNTIN